MSLRVRYQWTTPLRECLAISVGKLVSHDLELRATLWGEVAQEIKERFGIVVDTDDMKKTWKNLKDNYLRMRKMYDSEPEKAQKWHFFDAMRFMDRAGIDESATDGKMVTANDTSSRQTVRLKPVVMEGRIEFQPDVKEVVISNGPSIIHRKTQNRQRSHSKTMVIQVGFPEIDRLIITKQLPPNQLLRLPVDPNASELEQHLIDVWHKVETDERDMDIIVLDESYDDTPSPFTTDLSNIHTKTLEVEPSTSNGICSQSTCTYTEASGLKDLENYGTKLDESAKLFISSNVQKMRGLFHKTALECFISQNMPQGQLNNLLQAFDDHVFHKKPCSPLIDKVLSTCTQEIRDAFYNLFTILSRYIRILMEALLLMYVLRYLSTLCKYRKSEMNKEKPPLPTLISYKNLKMKRLAKAQSFISYRVSIYLYKSYQQFFKQCF
uniref:MADF domain-containing protein n=1 Tax=Heterorhabditis bacteriophora TaxID=37862 RepID=A0A1I7XPL2_HETBA